MSASLDSVRHRATGRPTTVLSDLTAAATGSLVTVSRRSAVVVASSGLIVSMFGAPASAAENESALSAVDVSTLTASARAALSTAPVVTVPVAASWSFDVPAVAIVADPPPKPAPTRAKVLAASRSQVRAAAPATPTAVKAAPAPAPTSIGAPAPASANGNAIVEIATRYVGVPYVYGGTTPAGFDCSGYTSYVFAQVGVTLPRTSAAQRGAGTVVSRADALPGDLIWSPGHIAIYAGGDLQVDSPRPGKSIQIRQIWQSNPVFIRVS